MSDFTPTAEQLAIIKAAKSTDDNILITALAGAAKTSTLILIAKGLIQTPILSLAFNKKIAQEMEQRLPGNCTSSTLNSLGHRAWGQAIGRRLVLNTDKVGTIIKNYIDTLNQREKDEAWSSFSNIRKGVEAGKRAGWLPDGSFPQAKPLIHDEELWHELEEEPTVLEWDFIRRVSVESGKRALTGEVDFNDQILMPTVLPAAFPRFPLVMVDEAQDLSELNHAMLRKLAKKRLIAVGDRNQAIYGFRGAHENSMSLLKAEFNMTEMNLTISFRCAQTIIEEARWRAPLMTWPDWAAFGSVTAKDSWTVEDIPDKAVILCRNNAPLFAIGIRLITEGRNVELVGNDIGRMLTRVFGKFGDKDMDREAVLNRIDHWEEEKAQKSRNPDRIYDQAECLRHLAAKGDTLGDIIAYAEHLLAQRGPISLMTGHRSKGLEFDTVFILDKHLIRNSGQDPNVLYVMQTRAKSNLVYINTDGFQLNLEKADVESNPVA